ncbi:hypothetical protein RS130_07420 [Paraglaciecola aquimarina]|uniref:Uncharacterized protein n=1 Tax=Paraglaciecola aquimarina TaxID=1235557 RepID=A0ABU3SUV5_9ALTE|nr:hypothetical protein [Paraglaciecola aquimarina]MDU0353777.1 hypothetical protein [Paraglaciecola aquimarina]
MKALFFILLAVMCFIFLAAYDDAEVRVIKHQVSFDHQGNKSEKPIEASLFEVKADSTNTEFYMDVNSVFCGENVCKLDKVRMFWDPLGRYKKYELAENVQLEKGNAEDFATEDYKKLDAILHNEQSGLATLYPAELVSQNRSGNAVDALSGATVSIHKQDTVEGAIWTCYTLWHYANGEITQIIRDISGRQKNVSELTALLTSADLSQQIFAIEQLAKKKEFDDETRSKLLDKSLLNQTLLQTPIIDYLEGLPKQQYQQAVLGLLAQDDNALLVKTLESIQEQNLTSSNEMSLALVELLAKAEDFQISNLILTLLTSYSVLSEDVLINLVAILNDQDFLKARGVYWLLSGYPLPQAEQQVLNSFSQTHAERL